MDKNLLITILITLVFVTANVILICQTMKDLNTEDNMTKLAILDMILNNCEKENEDEQGEDNG